MATISVDFDNTITTDPQGWADALNLLGKRGHKIIITTYRPPTHPIPIKGIPIFYTSGRAKKSFLDAKGVVPDIWIDDSAFAINFDESFKYVNKGGKYSMIDIIQKMPNFCALINHIMTHSPFEDHHIRNLFYVIAWQQNLAMLFACCEILHRRFPDRKLCFLSRDCQQMYWLFKTYYPTHPSEYVKFSRAFLVDPKAAAAYLAQHKPCIFVDLSSSGNTWAYMAEFDVFDSFVWIYSDMESYVKERPVPPSTFQYFERNSVIGETRVGLEIINCADHGQVLDINGTESMVSVDPGVIEACQLPVKMACENRSMRALEDFEKLTDDELRNIFRLEALSISNKKFLETLLE